MWLYVLSCTVHCDLCTKTMFGSSLPPVVCRRAYFLFMLFMLAYVQWCPKHILSYFSFVFLRFMHSMLPVSLNDPFLIAPSVFSNVYLFNRFSGFSIFGGYIGF